MDTFSINNYVSLNKVKIHNSLYSNILSQGSNLSATNCLFGNSNNYSGFISIGGNINFEHCTFSNYSSGYRTSPAFVLKDYYESTNGQIIFRPFNQANFTNCIIDGNSTTDFVCDTLGLDITGIPTNALFDHCSLKTEDTIENTLLNNCLFNPKIHFKNTEEWNFELTDSSEIIDLGKSSNISDDMLNNLRSIPNDLGCYEFQ